MSRDFLDFLVKMFYRPVHPGWIGFAVILGGIIVILLIIIDWGVSLWKIIVPAIILFLILAIIALKAELIRRKNLDSLRWQWRIERQKVERLRKLISVEPEF